MPLRMSLCMSLCMPLRHDVNEQPYQSSTIPHDVRQRRRERLHGLLTQADQ
jgi:hypothetical protein